MLLGLPPFRNECHSSPGPWPAQARLPWVKVLGTVVCFILWVFLVKEWSRKQLLKLKPLNASLQMNTFFVVQCCQARQCEKNNIFIILNNHSLLKCKLNKTLNALLQMNTFTWVWVRSWDSLFAGSTLLCKTVKKIKFKKMFWIVLELFELFDLWQWPVDSIRLWCSCLVPEDMAKPFFFFFFWCIGSTPLGQTTWLNSAPLWWTEVARICFPANCEQCVAMNQGQPPPPSPPTRKTQGRVWNPSIAMFVFGMRRRPARKVLRALGKSYQCASVSWF